MDKARHESKTKLLEAALTVIRTKGYSATRIDDVCKAAGVTKGSFFHHFAGKQELGIAAADYWSEVTGALFAAAPYHDHDDPLDRLLAYVDFRKQLLKGDVPEFTCLAGTMVQETFDSAPAIREACERCISDHAGTLEGDITAAMEAHGIEADWSARNLALHMQAVLQGAFVLAKAKGGAEIAADSVDHLRRYIELLFAQSRKTQYAGLSISREGVRAPPRERPRSMTTAGERNERESQDMPLVRWRRGGGGSVLYVVAPG